MAVPINPIFNDNRFDVNDNDIPTFVNYLDVVTLKDHFVVDNPDQINIKSVVVNVENQVRGQYYSGAEASITNLLVYFHDYKAYTHKFKYPVLSDSLAPLVPMTSTH